MSDFRKLLARVRHEIAFNKRVKANFENVTNNKYIQDVLSFFRLLSPKVYQQNLNILAKDKADGVYDESKALKLWESFASKVDSWFCKAYKKGRQYLNYSEHKEMAKYFLNHFNPIVNKRMNNFI